MADQPTVTDPDAPEHSMTSGEKKKAAAAGTAGGLLLAFLFSGGLLVFLIVLAVLFAFGILNSGAS